MPGWCRPALSICFVNLPGQFVGPLGNLANGIDLSIPVGLGLAAVLYPVLLFVFPEPADAFGPDGPRFVPAGPAANTPITSIDEPEITSSDRGSDRMSRVRTDVGPIDASKTPRFAGPASFARLPRLDQVPRADIVVVGRAVRLRRVLPARRPVRPHPRPRGVAAAAARTTRPWTSRRSRSPRSPTQAISR